jgi:hypothetical protein
MIAEKVRDENFIADLIDEANRSLPAPAGRL